MGDPGQRSEHAVSRQEIRRHRGGIIVRFGRVQPGYQTIERYGHEEKRHARRVAQVQYCQRHDPTDVGVPRHDLPSSRIPGYRPVVDEGGYQDVGVLPGQPDDK